MPFEEEKFEEEQPLPQEEEKEEIEEAKVKSEKIEKLSETEKKLEKTEEVGLEKEEKPKKEDEVFNKESLISQNFEIHYDNGIKEIIEPDDNEKFDEVKGFVDKTLGSKWEAGDQKVKVYLFSDEKQYLKFLEEKFPDAPKDPATFDKETSSIAKLTKITKKEDIERYKEALQEKGLSEKEIKEMDRGNMFSGVGHELAHLHPLFGGVGNKDSENKWEQEMVCTFIGEKIRTKYGNERSREDEFRQAREELKGMQKQGKHFSWEERGKDWKNWPTAERFVYPWLEEKYGPEKLQDLWETMFKEKKTIAETTKDVYGKEVTELEKEFTESLLSAEKYSGFAKEALSGKEKIEEKKAVREKKGIEKEPEEIRLEEEKLLAEEKEISPEEKSKLEKVNKLASLLHDEWRTARLDTEKGIYEPRIKTTKDSEWIQKHGGKTELDIANTPYEELPSDWQVENKASAEVAIEEVEKAVKTKTPLNNTFIEATSSVFHEKWLERNKSLVPPEQNKLYSELSEKDKEKDMGIIRKAIEVHQELKKFQKEIPKVDKKEEIEKKLKEKSEQFSLQKEGEKIYKTEFADRSNEVLEKKFKTKEGEEIVLKDFLEEGLKKFSAPEFSKLSKEQKTKIQKEFVKDLTEQINKIPSGTGWSFDFKRALKTGEMNCSACASLNGLILENTKKITKLEKIEMGLPHNHAMNIITFSNGQIYYVDPRNNVFENLSRNIKVEYKNGLKVYKIKELKGGMLSKIIPTLPVKEGIISCYVDDIHSAFHSAQGTLPEGLKGSSVKKLEKIQKEAKKVCEEKGINNESFEQLKELKEFFNKKFLKYQESREFKTEIKRIEGFRAFTKDLEPFFKLFKENKEVKREIMAKKNKITRFLLYGTVKPTLENKKVGNEFMKFYRKQRKLRESNFVQYKEFIKQIITGLKSIR
jgi:hypothetical protein